MISAEANRMTQSRGGREAPSQVGVIGAMRARDVSRPSADEITRAEQELEVHFRPLAERPKRPQLEDPRRRGQRESSGRGGSSPEAS